MKTLATVSAAALIALTGAASAMTATGAAEGQIRQYLPGFDLSVVDADTVRAAANYIQEENSDDSSFAYIQNGVRTILEN